MTLGTQLRQLRKLRGLSQEELASRTGLSRPYLSKLECNQEINPTVETLESLAKALGGEIRDFFAANETDDSFSGFRKRLRSGMAPVFDPGKGRDICAVMFQIVSDGEYPVGEAPRHEPCDSKDPNAFYVVARGNSMTGGAGRRQILDGDLLLVEPNLEVRDSDIVLSRRLGAETGALVKVFKRTEEGHVFLLPLNPEYPPIHIKPGEWEETVFYRITEIKRTL